jgi:hypothetical protein
MIVAIVLGSGCPGLAQSLPPNAVGRDLVMPLYADDAREPCALIHIGTLHRDYQTRGFYRIGVLPAVCAEEVEIEITHPTQARTTLSAAGPSLQGVNRCDLIELRGLRIQFPGEPAPLLQARRVRIAEEGSWDCVNGATLSQGGEILVLPRCRLTVHGPDAGRVTVDTDQGRKSYDLFAEDNGAHSTTQTE